MINFNNHKKEKLINNYNKLINNVYFQKTTKNLINNIDPKYKSIKYVIQKDDTISKILSNLNVDDKQIEEIKKKLSEKIDISNIKINQILSITISSQ